MYVCVILCKSKGTILLTGFAAVSLIVLSLMGKVSDYRIIDITYAYACTCTYRVNRYANRYNSLHVHTIMGIHVQNIYLQ